MTEVPEAEVALRELDHTRDEYDYGMNAPWVRLIEESEGVHKIRVDDGALSRDQVLIRDWIPRIPAWSGRSRVR